VQGSRALRACLLGLVLVDLVFVQLTEAAALEWLVPLYALTLCSPLLAPLRGKLAYRVLWNAAVLSFFALLVRHASGYDLRFVLQDGLVLAALCQVHLLNNLRDEQRPDLLFFNSFLIAIVTGYLCHDVAYPIAFLAYAPLFVCGLQLYCVIGEGADVEPRATRRILVDGLARSGVLLAATMLVFLFWPRDFQRRGLLAGRLDFSSRAAGFEVGFSESLELERRQNVRISDRVVMTVALLEGARDDVPALWRGATLGATNGKDWWPADARELVSAGGADEPWSWRGDDLVRGRAGHERSALVSVEHVDPEANRLFMPLGTERLRRGAGLVPERVFAEQGGTLRYGIPLRVRPALSYELAIGRDVPAAGGEPRAALPRALAPYAVAPRSRHVAEARDLAAKLAAAAPPGESQHALVARLCAYLGSRYAYLRPGARGAAASLDEFLAGDAGGHCEFFASALGTLLRLSGIPCRLATGFRSSEWDTEGRVLTIRRAHAHAWVEVFDPRAGWYAVDPSPAVSALDGPGLWTRLRMAASKAWARLASFNAGSRDALLAWLVRLPQRSEAWLRAHPLPSGLGGAALVLGLLAWRRRRNAGVAPVVRRYRRTLRRARIERLPGETPRELLARARASRVKPERLAALQAATFDHERSRYAA